MSYYTLSTNFDAGIAMIQEIVLQLEAFNYEQCMACLWTNPPIEEIDVEYEEH